MELAKSTVTDVIELGSSSGRTRIAGGLSLFHGGSSNYSSHPSVQIRTRVSRTAHYVMNFLGQSSRL